MKLLITGVAGFIGAHLAARLKNVPDTEIYGIDNLNTYYDPALKTARLDHLCPHITFYEADIADDGKLKDILRRVNPDVVVHLAAQAGVRHSFKQPMDYVNSNLVGHVSLLEATCATPSVRRLIYASSSSVYSGVNTSPFLESMLLGTPKSLYAATKVANEVLSDTYSSLNKLDMIGLRFFTVYGPWGRPDMAYWIFAKSIIEGREIKLFNHGDIRRDFTYIDDITGAILRMIDEVRNGRPEQPMHRVYNIGNESPEPVAKLISLLEQFLGAKGNVTLADLPKGDMVETCADVNRLKADFQFSPSTPLSDGIEKFSKWYLEWHDQSSEVIA